MPVVGVLSAAAMLHEPFGLREFIALAVALGGGLLLALARIGVGALVLLGALAGALRYAATAAPM